MRVERQQDLGPDPLKTVIVDINDWDMDTVASLDVDVKIHFNRWRSISVMIRNDDTTLFIRLSFNGDASGSAEHTNGKGNTIITLYRGVAGAFDNVNYNAADFNRGYITLGYI